MNHARFSPSAAHRWIPCPGSVALSDGLKDEGSEYAAEGNAAHELATMVFEHPQQQALAFLGRKIKVGEREFEVDEEMASNVQIYVDKVKEYAGAGQIFVEQRVPLEKFTGEKDAEGTSDVIVILDDEIQVHDLKYGRGKRVEVERNPQTMLYGLGTVEKFGALGDFKRVRLVIHQPRLGPESEWDCPLPELELFKETITNAVATAEVAIKFKANWEKDPDAAYLVPGDEQCQYCKAKATCPALAKKVADTVGKAFEFLAAVTDKEIKAGAVDQLMPASDIHLKMQSVDLIEDWCKAIRAHVEALLFDGKPVEGYKLVEGRRGARKWTDEKTVEELMRKTFRLTIEEAFNLKLISPTQAEKVLKETPKRWGKLQDLITQSEGKPSVAAESDKRPALVIAPTADAFEDHSLV